MLYVLTSLLLGVISWAAAIVNLFAKRGKHSKYLPFVSFSSCLISVYTQLVFMDSYSGKGQWGAIDDTLDALSFVVPVLILVTIALNFAGIYRAGKEQ